MLDHRVSIGAMPAALDCRHTGDLAARWDYLTQDDTCGTGWIVCKECWTTLERINAAGGRFRGSGRFFAAFVTQLATAEFSGLRDLEVD